ncbi:TonB-dependent receptor [Aliidiomarina halalkaliphila]|uniref:TonB-dependent receptor n=1 Tax=Aliidiomarina halalkaliphila TaxID=2593535 RepID=A0A552X542_9GAMM|nr:TonB-dependent receptor [Aliidiomarina halalkaliphila]TRW50151.1 TonB-dependent receptor [Aliidiomarina halalkaliphila]
MRKFKMKPLALVVAAALAPQSIMAQEADAETQVRSERVERIVVTGTRVAGRSAEESTAPVDIVRGEDLARAGITELNQALSVALPSFNFPRPGLADGTDTVRPATLRGLSPDQTLVLVNSKRRHQAALVNVNGTVGRGSSAVDLNTIPIGAVQSVEVLRDGASAQYGSDAIAGVINVRLREAREGGSVSLQYGWRDTSYTTPTTPPPAGATWSAPSEITRSRSDGETVTLNAWTGLPLTDNGYLTLALEYKDQERTERGGWDYRQQYELIDGEFDPREATFDRFSAWYGEPEIEQLTLFANAGINLDDGSKFYGWASYQDRQAVSAGFYRPARDARNVPEIYPDGFLPLIAPDVEDMSLAAGYEWQLGEWAMDTSLVFGQNEMMFTIKNTLNRSMGVDSPTEFDAGGYRYNQLVYNLSGVRFIDVDGLASPLNLAMGLEARREGYRITAGEPASYINGGVTLNGNPTASGSQVFPGFRPSNAVSESRTAIGAYVDVEAEMTLDWLVSGAIRVEEYSDFGSTVTGKIATRYDISDDFALRASLQNGFRAPSLQQQYFTATSTNFINGVPFDITTFPVADPVAVALGARPLDAEESINLSLGAVMRFGNVSVTVDAYRIDIDDRIVLSENLVQPNVREYLEEQGFVGIGGGRFFINGVDTETQGVDVVVTWPWMTENAGTFDFNLVGNFNRTKVTRVPATAELEALDPAPTLFARTNVLTFEKGTPKNKLGLITNWNLDNWSGTMRITRYGEVLSPNNNPALDFELSAKTLVDLEGRYDFNENWSIALGADNIFDTYPDPNPIQLNTTGATSFSNYSPFGRSGRFVYGRVAYRF